MIVTFLKWALSKFETPPDATTADWDWPFPTEEAIEKAKAAKTKPRVAKAPTRKPAAKTSPAAKRTAAKKAK